MSELSRRYWTVWNSLQPRFCRGVDFGFAQSTVKRALSEVEGQTTRVNQSPNCMPYMYILECVDGSYYVGSTKDLERRLWEHQQGLGAKHTAKRLPVKLVYCEFYDRVSDAFYREKQVQGWGRKKKEALMAGDTNELHRLAECQNETHYRRRLGFGFAQPTSFAQPTDCVQEITQPSKDHSTDQTKTTD